MNTSKVFKMMTFQSLVCLPFSSILLGTKYLRLTPASIYACKDRFPIQPSIHSLTTSIITTTHYTMMLHQYISLFIIMHLKTLYVVRKRGKVRADTPPTSPTFSSTPPAPPLSHRSRTPFPLS